ncbi:MAG TPA: hypothetical protein VMV52_04360 [Candidatus Nanopelagicaceae bacterium]|nr:hypothetical protein [Candidatus Nanopelagicaceae bacterium]
MKRTFWFLAGVGTTLGVIRKLDRAKESVSVEKLGAAAGSIVSSVLSTASRQVFDFIEDVRVASKLREREIYDSLDPDQG